MLQENGHEKDEKSVYQILNIKVIISGIDIRDCEKNHLQVQM